MKLKDASADFRIIYNVLIVLQAVPKMHTHMAMEKYKSHITQYCHVVCTDCSTSTLDRA